MTCDAWSASNIDNYFAVTVHWVEELNDGTWELKNALAGFVRMQQAHTGIRMGQVLFKVMQG